MSAAVDTGLVKFATRQIKTMTLAVFGMGSPEEQMAFSILLMAAAIAASVVTLGATILLVVVFGATFFWGLARYLLRMV